MTKRPKPSLTKAGTPRKRAPGAGPPTLSTPDDPTEQHMVTMPRSYWERAKAAGHGKHSPGIRTALDTWQRIQARKKKPT